MSHRTIAGGALLTGCLLAGAACTTQLGAPGGGGSFPEAVQLYRESSDTRAMAVAVDDGGRRAWGVFYAPTQGRANEGAVEECTRNAARAGVDAPCVLFAETTDAPTTTIEGCRAGRISQARCAVQEKYGPRPGA